MVKSELMKIKDVQEELQYSRHTVYRLMEEEGLPYEQYPGRRMIRRSDLQAWRDARRVVQGANNGAN